MSVVSAPPTAPVSAAGGWPAVVPPGTTMRAVVVRGFGAPEVLHAETVPTPRPAEGEALVQVAAVSVGRFLDVAARQGRHPYAGFTFPHVFGAEHAGVVAAVGQGVDAALVGSRVAGFPNVTCGHCRWCLRGDDELCRSLELVGTHRQGADAQYVAVPARNLRPVPPGVSPAQVTGLALAGAVAMNQLRRARFEPGQWVLVQGAAGSLGLLTVGLALHLGARVVAASRSAGKRQSLLELGVEAVVDPAGDVADQVLALTDGFGADIVVDNLGEPGVWASSFASVAPGGTVVSSGAFLGHQQQVDLRRLYLQGQHLLGVRTGNAASVAALWDEVDNGFRPPAGSTFPLEQADQAHRLMEGDANLGRVALLVDHPR